MVLGPRMWSLVRVSGKQHEKNVKMLQFPHENVIFTIFHVLFSFLGAIKLKFFFGRSCEYKIICFSFKDFRQQSPRVSYTSVDERFPARQKIMTKNSVCLKKKELVDMYRDDFQNTLRKQRQSLFILGSFIQPRSQVAD